MIRPPRPSNGPPLPRIIRQAKARREQQRSGKAAVVPQEKASGVLHVSPDASSPFNERQALRAAYIKQYGSVLGGKYADLAEAEERLAASNDPQEPMFETCRVITHPHEHHYINHPRGGWFSHEEPG